MALLGCARAPAEIEPPAGARQRSSTVEMYRSSANTGESQHDASARRSRAKLVRLHHRAERRSRYARSGRSSIADLQQQLDRRTRELDEAREHRKTGERPGRQGRERQMQACTADHNMLYYLAQ
jgi:hypothetical protein